MNLRQLEIFSAVMATGTTVGAAEMLNISQPAVSNMIKHLEGQLRLTLFTRVKGRLVATEEAELLFERSRDVFTAFETVNFLAGELKDSKQGHLRVVATPAMATSIAPLAVAEFRQSRPKVKVSLSARSIEFLISAIEQEKAHVGVYFAPIEHPLIASEEIGSISLVCVMPKGHALSEKPIVRPGDITGTNFISYDPEDHLGILIDNAFRIENENFQPDIQVHYSQTACDLVLNGAGVAVVDCFSLLRWDILDRVDFRPFEPKIITPIYVAYHKTRPLSRLARLYITQLRNAVTNRFHQLAERTPEVKTAIPNPPGDLGTV